MQVENLFDQESPDNSPPRPHSRDEATSIPLPRAYATNMSNSSIVSAIR